MVKAVVEAVGIGMRATATLRMIVSATDLGLRVRQEKEIRITGAGAESKDLD